MGVIIGSIGYFIYIDNSNDIYNRSVSVLRFNSSLNIFWALSNDNIELAKNFVAQDIRVSQNNMIHQKDTPSISPHIDSLINIALKYNDINNDVPDGLLTLIHQLEIDSSAPWGFNDIKSHPSFDSTITFKDIHFGVPINVYYINNEKLLLPSNLPINSYIYKTNKWFIPVYGKNKCIRALYAQFNKNNWYFSSSSCCAYSNAWQKFRKKWPVDNSTKPIIIDFDPITLIHFPEIDSFNLIYLMGSDNDSNNFVINQKSSEIINRMSTILKSNVKKYLENPCILDPEKCVDDVKR